jgi:hypothetical protein
MKEVRMLRQLFRKSFLVPTLALAALMAWPAVSNAQFKQGDWVLTLAGTGDSNKDFNRGAFELGGSVGYFVTQNIELAVHQDLGYAEHPSVFTGVTQLSADWVFDLGRWAPYLGVNGGLAYGTHAQGESEVGPEAGVRYFINSTTFVFGQIEWDFHNDNHGSGAASGFQFSTIVYTVGLGVKLN